MSTDNTDFDQDFDLAMEEALGGAPAEDAPQVEEKAKEEPEVEEKAKEEPEVEEEPEPKAEEEPEPKAEEEPKAEPKAEEPKADPKVSALEQKIADLEAKLSQEPEKKEEQEPEKDEKLTEEPTEDQKKVLDDVKKDWGDLDKAMDVKIEMALNKVENLFTDRLKQFQESIKPYQQTTEHVARNAHEAKIFSAHPDAKDVYKDMIEWIGKQPSVAARAYQQALKEGSAEEIIEVFDTYKETNKQPEVKPEKKTDPEKEEKLNKMEAVKSEQHVTKAEDDPDDFDGAFAQALKSA